MTDLTYPLEAFVDLPAPLRLGPEFLGLRCPAVVGGVAVHVVIPDFRFDKQTGWFSLGLHSKTKAKWAELDSGPLREDHRPFGAVTSWNPLSGGINEFWAYRLQLFSMDRATESEAQDLLLSLDAWVDLLVSWIEIVARVDLHTEEVVIQRRYGESGQVWLDEGKNAAGKTVRPKHGAAVTLNRVRQLEITPVQWARLLDRASAVEQPPEAHLFLRDARRSMNEGRNRRSVLDAATAAEVSLTKLRDGALVTADPHIDKYVRGKAQQINGLVAFLREMGQALPSGIQQKVGEPRNRAIHKGEEPVHATAKEAVRKAEEVVDLAFPWEGLLSPERGS